MSEARAVTNFVGNAVATLLIGCWVGELDKTQAERVLAGDLPFDETTMLDDHEQAEPEKTTPAAVPAPRKPEVLTS